MTEHLPSVSLVAMRQAAQRAADYWRAREEKDGLKVYKMNRTGREFVLCMRGVRHVFEYVRALGVPRVLDVGAGLTIATKQVAERYAGLGIDVRATALTQSTTPLAEDDARSIYSIVSENLGWDKTYVTSVEELEGVADASQGAVFAAYSLHYSVAPLLAVQSIDRVLTPGGVFKGHLHTEKPRSNPAGISAASDFEAAFRTLGYDIHKKEMSGTVVMLAIKPGGPQHLSAQELLAADEADFRAEYSAMPAA